MLGALELKETGLVLAMTLTGLPKSEVDLFITRAFGVQQPMLASGVRCRVS